MDTARFALVKWPKDRNGSLLSIVRFEQLRFNFLSRFDLQYKSRSVQYIDVFDREKHEEYDDENEHCLFVHSYESSVKHICFDNYFDLYMPQLIPVEEFNGSNNTYTCWLRTTVWVIGNYASCIEGLTKYMLKFHNK